MPGRSLKTSTYRFGFNGKENDNEVKGTGNQQDYGMRIYDPRAGRFLSVDPLTKNYPMLTPYQFASNKPIIAIDLDGAEAFMKIIQYNSSGKAAAVNIMYDESVKALPVGQMYVQHAYPTGSVIKTEGLGTLDFSDKSYGYPNKMGHKDYAVREEYNPFYNPSDVNKTTLFSEFMTGLGAENSLIIGGKMIDDIKSMESVKSLINQGMNSIMADGKIEAGESFFQFHHMTYKEGATDIWIPSLLNGGVKEGSQSYLTTQHFLGSFSLRIDILEDNKTALFTLSDSKSLESVTDHQKKGNSIFRQPGKSTPWGTTYQRYMWTAPITVPIQPPSNNEVPKDNTNNQIPVKLPFQN